MKRPNPILTLAAGGVPDVDICFPANAVPTIEYAAEEFRRHLCLMTGAKTCVRSGRTRVCIGDSDAAGAAGIDVAGLALQPEAFHVETRNGSLFIVGGGPRGVLYGVYEVLERLGCRWYTTADMIIPFRRRIEFPAVRITQTPAFEFRDTFNWELRDSVTWVRQRLNGCYCPVPSYLGGQITYGGFVHTFYELLPPDEFFATHPDYFSLVNGTRRREAAQLCLTHPVVRRIVTDRVRERMRQNPAATIFSVSQNDCANPCECSGCRAVVAAEGAQSGPILRFVNAIARATAREFPDKLIDTLAYCYSLDAPRLTKPHPNVRIRLCSINCCQGHGYGTCDHPTSQQFLRALEAWGQRTSQLYIWHYATNFSHYLLPMPDLDELHANLNLYRRHGVHGVLIQSCYEEGGGAEMLALRGYVTSKLLWNPNQSVWPLVDEFLRAYYGPAAAPHVRRYLDVFHHRVRADRTLHPSLYDSPDHSLFDRATLTRAGVPLALAESHAHGTTRQRVRQLRHGLRYARLHSVGGRFRRDGDTYCGDATPADGRALAKLVRDCRRAGIEHLREGTALDFTAQIIRNRLTAHPIEWLRSNGQEIVIVPGLGGRLLEWHAHGRQWLAPPDPNNQWNPYPTNGGFCEFALTGMYQSVGWAESYRVSRRVDGLTLTAPIGAGMRLHRRFVWRGSALEIRSRLTNTGSQPQRCRWAASLQLAGAGARTSLTTRAGQAREYSWAELPDGLGAAVVMDGAACPAGKWTVTVDGVQLTHQFQGPMDQAILGKVATTGSLVLDLRSAFVNLLPGQNISVRQTIQFETEGKSTCNIQHKF